MPVGTLVIPDPSDVRAGVLYGADGTEYVGTLACGLPILPDAPAVGSSPFAAIASGIRSRIAITTGVAIDFINLVANDHYVVTQEEPLFVYIRIYGPGAPRDPALSYENSGAGRRNRPIARRVRCYIYTRTGEDVYGSDNIALLNLNPSQTVSTPPVMPGQFVAEEMIYNCLDDWMPIDSDGNPLALGPLHPLDSQDGPPERRPEDDDGLVRSHIDFEVVYISCIVPDDPIA